MIAHLSGTLIRTQDTSLILSVHGVGYEVFCPRSTLDYALSSPDSVTLEVLTLYKQESVTLFGFQNLEDRSLFEVLLSVQGVGGKMALSLLSALSPSQLITAIHQQDHVPLTQADGVGPKLAQRITRELKDKIKKLGSFDASVPMSSSDFSKTTFEDASKALETLGYKPNEIANTLKKLSSAEETPLTTDQIITLALQKLSQH